MERFDAAIIGAGPDGLIAAHRLAGAGLRVIVLERRDAPGGRAATREFHPGFRASPYCDEIAPLPVGVFRQMDLPRRGALFMPAPASICISPGKSSIIYNDADRMARLGGPAGAALAELYSEIELLRAAISRMAQAPTLLPRVRVPWRRQPPARWPGDDWRESSLADALDLRIGDPALGLHLAAHVLASAAASPYLPGTALHLLRGLRASGLARGGLGTLGSALASAARAAGAELRLGCDVTDIRVEKGAATGIVLSGGEEIYAKTVISTLDLKQTFLGLIPWHTLATKFIRHVGQFRMAGSSARVLFALDAPPAFAFAAEAKEAVLGPIHIVESLDAISRVHGHWRTGVLSESLPVTLRIPSLLDPSLAPAGKAVMTATLSGVPAKLFDGPWNSGKRTSLAALALRAAERAAPGTAARILAVRTIIPDDIERDLGPTAGDLEGGELAPDQALGYRPFPESGGARTPLRHLYLGGPSSPTSPYLTGGGGMLAAASLLADMKSRRLR